MTNSVGNKIRVIEDWGEEVEVPFGSDILGIDWGRHIIYFSCPVESIKKNKTTSRFQIYYFCRGDPDLELPPGSTFLGVSDGCCFWYKRIT